MYTILSCCQMSLVVVLFSFVLMLYCVVFSWFNICRLVYFWFSFPSYLWLQSETKENKPSNDLITCISHQKKCNHGLRVETKACKLVHWKRDKHWPVRVKYAFPLSPTQFCVQQMFVMKMASLLLKYSCSAEDTRSKIFKVPMKWNFHRLFYSTILKSMILWFVIFKFGLRTSAYEFFLDLQSWPIWVKMCDIPHAVKICKLVP